MMSSKQSTKLLKKKYLLIRGLGREQGHWLDFESYLLQKNPNIQVYYIDLPGNGDFHKQSITCSILDYSKFLQDKIKQNSALSQSPINIIAMSMGAMVVLKWIEVFFPDNIENVYLLNTSCRSFSPSYKRLKPLALAKLLYSLLPHSPRKKEEMILEVVCNFEKARTKAIVPWTHIHNSRPVSLCNLLKQIIASSKFKLSSPVFSGKELFFIQSLKDQMVDQSCSEKLAKFYSAKLITNELAGHDISIDNPSWLVENIVNSD